ncbi:hypothetical protein NUW58_g9438 [Xylaria curta]|uniref:Uncharacterized protein n=1 Tax=Xylaria curta TaxID=42375 RepID=A0ACC1MXW5_9PEZI|nr:hypothetical protein NUW58_g9438 [Xylaria curta]
MAAVEDPRNVPTTPTPQTTDPEPPTPETAQSKPIHALILDAGPLIKNDPPVSTLLAQADELYTLPSVISEIRDAATRSRVETTLLPFLKLRSPRPTSIKFVTDFARRTGDLEVLSKPDVHLMALAYELECEMNGGDWRLRRTPGQKGVNGKSPAQMEKEKAEAGTASSLEGAEEKKVQDTEKLEGSENTEEDRTEETPSSESTEATDSSMEQSQPIIEQEVITQTLDSLSLEQSAAPAVDFATENTEGDDTKTQEEEDDDEGWITPSNLKKHQAKDQLALPEQPTQRVLKVALLTSDYAMQNVRGCCGATGASEVTAGHDQAVLRAVRAGDADARELLDGPGGQLHHLIEVAADKDASTARVGRVASGPQHLARRGAAEVGYGLAEQVEHAAGIGAGRDHDGVEVGGVSSGIRLVNAARETLGDDGHDQSAGGQTLL